MGEGGEAWFFQSELPYGVNQTDYADKGTTGYRVGPDVKTHSANGVGAYTYFRDYKVTVKSGFVVPDTPGVKLTNAFTLFLFCGPVADKDACGVSITNVVNDVGGSISIYEHKYVCSYSNGHYTLGDSLFES
jgi:hypothetical protein